MTRCNIQHGFCDARCVRVEGHDGLCWSRAYRADGALHRAEWYSQGGKFKSHHQYVRTRAQNTQPKETTK